MVSAVAFANELERELASQRAHDAALKRAKEGRNFGGRVYGYDNIHRLPNGTETEAAPGAKKPIDAQTIYRINPTEAEVVRGIFRACADGRGLTAIAKALNGDPAYSGIAERYFDGQRPAPPRKGTGSWAPPPSAKSCTASVTVARSFRSLPQGGAGDGSSRAREPAEYLLIEKPELRVVDEDLWHRTQTRPAPSAPPTRPPPHARASPGISSRPDAVRAVRRGDDRDQHDDRHPAQPAEGAALCLQLRQLARSDSVHKHLRPACASSTKR